MRRRLLVLLGVLALVAAGCGDDESPEETNSVTVTLPGASTGRVYWLREGKVWPAAVDVESADDPAEAVLDELLAGPDDDDREWGAETALADDVEVGEIVVDDGVAHLIVATTLSDEARAQIVYTLTQFPSIESVEMSLRNYTRADFEDQTPSVLVESPLPFEEVTTPLTVTGTANTFEATFQYELLDADGNVVDDDFVTATSGTGTRGTFEFTTADVEDVATLVVFEISAEDGSRMREVEIPLGDAS